MAPATTFTLGFLFCCTWAFAYADRWSLDLHLNTYCVIAGGCLLFLIVGHFVFSLFQYARYGNASQKRIVSQDEVKLIEIEKWKLLLVVAVQVFSAFITMRAIMAAAGTSNITEAIHYYNTINKFSEDSIVLQNARLIWVLWINMQALGFWFAYVFANNLAAKRFSWLPLIIVLLSMVNCLARGARTNAALMAAVILCYYVIIVRKTDPQRLKGMKLGLFLGIAVALVVFIASFKQIGLLMGRNITSTPMDYVSMYVGAEIKNLDTFLQGKVITSGSGLWGEQTFMAVYGALKDSLGITQKMMLDLPDQYVNGLWLGNVYTTFYPYYYDFGYLGVIVLTALMSLISHVDYEYAIRSKLRSRPNFSLVLYGYLWCSLLLSFFSNKFYERSFSESFLLIMICWGLYSLFFCRLKTGRNFASSYVIPRRSRRRISNHYTVNYSYRLPRSESHAQHNPRDNRSSFSSSTLPRQGGVNAIP